MFTVTAVPQLMDPSQPIISHYELEGHTIVIQMDSLISDPLGRPQE